MEKQKIYTLTPEVLLALAQLPVPKDKADGFLEESLAYVELLEASNNIATEFFEGSFHAFVLATRMFLNTNNFLPELPDALESTPDPDIFDSIDDLEDRQFS